MSTHSQALPQGVSRREFLVSMGGMVVSFTVPISGMATAAASAH